MFEIEFFFYLDRYRFSMRMKLQEKPLVGQHFSVPLKDGLTCMITVSGSGFKVGDPPVLFYGVRIKGRDGKKFLEDPNSLKWAKDIFA